MARSDNIQHLFQLCHTYLLTVNAMLSARHLVVNRPQ